MDHGEVIVTVDSPWGSGGSIRPELHMVVCIVMRIIESIFKYVHIEYVCQCNASGSQTGVWGPHNTVCIVGSVV